MKGKELERPRLKTPKRGFFVLVRVERERAKERRRRVGREMLWARQLREREGISVRRLGRERKVCFAGFKVERFMTFGGRRSIIVS